MKRNVLFVLVILVAPLLAFGKHERNVDLGVREGFYDIAQTLCEAFALPSWPRGQSFLQQALA